MDAPHKPSGLGFVAAGRTCPTAVSSRGSRDPRKESLTHPPLDP